MLTSLLSFWAMPWDDPDTPFQSPSLPWNYLGDRGPLWMGGISLMMLWNIGWVSSWAQWSGDRRKHEGSGLGGWVGPTPPKRYSFQGLVPSQGVCNNWGLKMRAALGMWVYSIGPHFWYYLWWEEGCLYWDHPPDSASFQNVVPDQRHLGTGRTLSTSTDLLNQKLWKWGSTICILTSPPGDSDARSSLRTICLET